MSKDSQHIILLADNLKISGHSKYVTSLVFSHRILKKAKVKPGKIFDALFRANYWLPATLLH